jgi:hypothetical protein
MKKTAIPTVYIGKAKVTADLEPLGSFVICCWLLAPE